MNTISLNKEEYKRMIELLFLGDFIKNSDYVPKDFEDLINQPDHKLLQKIFKQAKQFDAQNLFEQHQDLPIVPKNADQLVDKYFDF